MVLPLPRANSGIVECILNSLTCLYIMDLNQNRLDGMSMNRRSPQTTNNNRVKREERLLVEPSLDAPLLVV